MTTHRTLVAALGLALLLAACGGAAATPSPSAPPPDATPTPVPVPDPTAVPGGGGGSEPNPGGGALPVPPVNPGQDDGEGATPVQPVPGAAGAHEVAAIGLRAAVDGRRVTAEPTWWSGVEPCYVLAGVDVVRDGSAFMLTILEGSAAGPDVVCIELAMLKSTTVDLGELEPGTYTIQAFGEAAPVEVTVEG